MARARLDLAHSAERVLPSRVAVHLEGRAVVRHLAVGQACPMDRAVVTRSHCSACPSFVSFRLALETPTIGCDWGQDVAAWLRHEMSMPDRPARARTPRAATRTPPARRPGQPFTAGAVGIFLAAFGVGLALSAFERPS